MAVVVVVAVAMVVLVAVAVLVVPMVVCVRERERFGRGGGGGAIKNGCVRAPQPPTPHHNKFSIFDIKNYIINLYNQNNTIIRQKL